MTSPGGNLVEIRVVVRDQSGPGFDSATRRGKGLAAAMSSGPGSVVGSMKEAEKQASGLGGTLRRVGEVAGGVLVANVVQQMAQRAVQLVKSTAQAASGLSESVNAVNKTFEDGAQEVTDWGAANANAIGLSQRAFNQSATVLGAMLKNQGLALEDVTAHTTKLAERAADMASVFNTDVGDALAAIQAGLRGEIDPLERYGVSLSAAAVEQRALADSGKSATNELTAQDKALARLAVLYEQTDDVAGDFRDTSDGMANAQRVATAQIEDAQAKIGTAFMPVLAKASQLTGNLAQSFAGLPGPLQAAAVAVIGLGAAIGFLGPKALAAKAALDSMAASDSRMQRGMARSAVVVGRATAAIAAIAVAGAVAGAALGDDLNPQVEALTKGFQEWVKSGKQAGEFTRVFGQDLKDLDLAFRQVGDPAHGALKSIEGFLNLGDISDSHTRSAELIKLLDSTLAGMVRSGNLDEAADGFEQIRDRAVALGLSTEEVHDLFTEYNAALEVNAKKTNAVAEAAEEAAKSVDELDKEYDQIIDTAFGFEEAQDRAADAVADLNEQLQKQREDAVDGAGALTGNTQAARDNREAVRGLVELYKDLMIQAQRSGQSTDGLRQELEDQLVQMGFARDEARRYTEQLARLEEELAKIKSKTISVTILENRRRGTGFQEFAHGGVTGAAGGGPRSNQVLVGEQGPEIVDLAPGSMVHSNPDSMRMLSQASQPGPAAGPTEVVFSGDTDGAFASAFMKLVREGRITIRSQAVRP